MALSVAALCGCGGSGGGSDGGGGGSGATLAVADAARDEGDAGTTDLIFTVTLSGAESADVTVDFATAAGSASAGADYISTSGSLTFAAGITTQGIGVPMSGDLLVEADETFTLTLSAPANATLADATATGTILNDDASGGTLGLDARPSNTTCIAPARPSGNASVDVVAAFSPAPTFGPITKLLQAPGDTSRWFVLEQGGLLKVFSTFNPGSVSTWIDLSGRVNDSGEGGLLGLAFHPNWPATRQVFVS